MAASVEVISVDETIPVKKARIEEKENDENLNIHEELKDLSKFKLEKIIHINSNRKSVCLQGKFDLYSGDALIILEKTAFEEKSLKQDSDFFTSKSFLNKQFYNDIYGNYEFFPKVELNSIKATIIHPATEQHIQKYSVQNIYIVDETPAIYESITLPHITEKQFDLQWVYNILEHKSETDRIVFEDPDPVNGFILLPDLKWNGTTVENLYLLAIVHQRDLKSLRDLNGSHLQLLKNIKEKGTQAIKEKYGLDGSQLRIYFHYQPSFYHLHVHFTYLKYEAPGILAERAHLLSNVISSIELIPNYYQKVTLPFVVRENDDLFNTFEKKGYLVKNTVTK